MPALRTFFLAMRECPIYSGYVRRYPILKDLDIVDVVNLFFIAQINCESHHVLFHRTSIGSRIMVRTDFLRE